MSYFSRDETEIGSFGDVDARSADFSTGQTTLAPTTGLLAPLTAAQLAKSAAGRAAFNAGTLAANATTTRNLNLLGKDLSAATLDDSYAHQRAVADRAAIASSNRDAAAAVAADKNQGAWNFAGLDFGLLPAAAKVAVPLIATAATGGLAAPALLPAIKQIGSAATSAKATIATGDIKGTVSLVKQADNVITRAKAGAADAKALIDNTVKEATGGNSDAAAGLFVLKMVDRARVYNATKAGAPLAPAAVNATAAVLPRMAFSEPAFSTVVQPAVAPRAVPLAPLAKSIAPSDDSLAALQRYTRSALPTDPKYLVLDSGQVLANELARQLAPGWLVRFDGQVLRQ